MIHFIGVYDYTVVLTYISLLSAVYGMMQAIHGDYKMAVFSLALCGVCDAFDGRIARTKKNRTQDEKSFGIQLDSLCDVVCFGVFPAMICYLLGVRGILGLCIVFFYCICAVSRLAYFNVQEEKRQQVETGCNKEYRGLPVTSISCILPLAFWMQFFCSELVFLGLLHLILVLVGFLFILDFPLRKPTLNMVLALIAFVSVTVGLMFAYTRLRLPAQDDKSDIFVNEIIEEINETEVP